VIQNNRTRTTVWWSRGGVILSLVFLVIGALWLEVGAVPQKPMPHGISNTQMSQSGSKLERLTAWDIIKMNDWFLWPFVLLTGTGIMINVHRVLFEYRDRTRSQALLQGKIQANGIRNLVQVVRSSRNGSSSRAARLFYQIIATFDKTNQAQPINDDINHFLSAERETFERFTRVNGFLSDSAGALGLLGTVWGIFVTFYTANFDGPSILRGMSIALVTTLTGLIISLLLNFSGTYCYTMFNRQINLLMTKAEELRQALLYLEKKSNGNGTPAPAREEPVNYRAPEPEMTPRKPAPMRPAIDFSY